ncbi:MAG TPA: hypothetical protein VER33_11785 [Polyangiaceae bacterium]|nr:hypothetical protein [Polyangiaceae bacterium]
MIFQVAFRKLWLVALVGLLVVAAIGGWWWKQRTQRPAPPPVITAAPRPAEPSSVQDPLQPSRPAKLDRKRAQPSSDEWVRARPGFQYSRSAQERGGEHPCATQKVDTSAFEPWKGLSQGRFTAPRSGALDAQGRFNLVVHFLGDDLAQRELILSRQNFVLYSLTVGTGTSFAPLFSGSGLFASIVSQIEKHMSEREGRPARVGHTALSAWSAGFEGVRAVLYQPEARDVDAVILVDGLHGPREANALRTQFTSFIDFAKRAAAEERFMFISHSSIETYDYASSTESAHFLIAELQGKPQPVHREDALGLELVELFTRGDFHVRGYAGNDKADHCAQLAVLRDAYAALGRRWSP